MSQQNIKIIVLVLLGILAVVMLFLAAFQYFKPERMSAPSGEENAAVTDDPASTLYISEDAGETWRGITDARFTPYHIVFEPERDKLLIGTQESGVWELTSDKPWHLQKGERGNALPENAAVFDLAVSAHKKPAVYAAAKYGDQGYLVSLENPLRELFFAPLEDSPVRVVVIDPFTEQRLFIGSGTGLFESKDQGGTWKAAHRFKQPIMDVILHPHVPGLLFVSTSKGEVFQSSDDGKTWKDLSRGFSRIRGSREHQRLHSDPASGILYLTSDHGLLASEDDGVTWNDIPLIVPPDSLPVTGFAVHPARHTTFYISAGNQLYKSTDGGDTWKGIRFPEKGSITVIALHPKNPDMIVLGFAPPSSRSGIFNFSR